MAYSLDLAGSSLDRFEEIVTTVELLPSRRMRKMPANNKRYDQLAQQLGIGKDHLALVNREVNSYRTKPLPLGKLGLPADSELAALAGDLRGSRHRQSAFRYGAADGR